ncbi:MAG: hypothetical protein ACP5VE_15130 [Chthonomonadales bacterium]
MYRARLNAGRFLLFALAVGVASTALAQRALRLASTQSMVSPCCNADAASTIPWPFGHGKCDSHECWSDPNPDCSCQQDEWGNRLCTERLYDDGYARRWDSFGTEDCTNTILNGVCYTVYYHGWWPVPNCAGPVISTEVVLRDFCRK